MAHSKDVTETVCIILIPEARQKGSTSKGRLLYIE